MRRWIEINGNRHQLSRPVVVLGRSTEADVRIDDPGVSRKHAEIRIGMPSTIQDMGSTNGIVVDGQHTMRATLREGGLLLVNTRRGEGGKQDRSPSGGVIRQIWFHEPSAVRGALHRAGFRVVEDWEQLSVGAAPWSFFLATAV